MGLLVLLLFIAFAIGVFRYLTYWENQARDKWEVVAEGEFLKAIHGKIQTGTPPTLRVSTIIFKDGRTIPVANILTFPAPDTKIRVSKNGLYQFKIETAD